MRLNLIHSEFNATGKVLVDVVFLLLNFPLMANNTAKTSVYDTHQAITISINSLSPTVIVDL